MTSCPAVPMVSIEPAVVVVGLVGNRTGLDEPGDEHRTGDAAAGGGVLTERLEPGLRGVLGQAARCSRRRRTGPCQLPYILYGGNASSEMT